MLIPAIISAVLGCYDVEVVSTFCYTYPADAEGPAVEVCESESSVERICPAGGSVDDKSTFVGLE